MRSSVNETDGFRTERAKAGDEQGQIPVVRWPDHLTAGIASIRSVHADRTSTAVHVGNCEHLTTVVSAAVAAGRSMFLLVTDRPPGALAATPGRAGELGARHATLGGRAATWLPA
jgi:hypothetical protein